MRSRRSAASASSIPSSIPSTVDATWPNATPDGPTADPSPAPPTRIPHRFQHRRKKGLTMSQHQTADTDESAEAFDSPTVIEETSKGPDDAAESQANLSQEIEGIETQYKHDGEAGKKPEAQPRLDYRPYRSSILRHPTKDPRHADPETIELFSPAFGHRDIGTLESDLTVQADGEPIGERIRVTGRVLDGQGRPVRNQLVEIWQANSAGRYIHKRDQ